MKGKFIIGILFGLGILMNLAQSEELVYTLNFREPKLDGIQLYGKSFTKIHLQGSFSIGKNVGAPVTQVTPIRLLLPQGKEVSSIDVITETVEIDTKTEGVDLRRQPIFPHQPPMPIGEPAPAFLAMDDDLYKSESRIPDRTYESIGVGYCRGYAILTLNLYPTQYIPGKGRLFYHSKMTIKVNLEDTGYENRFYRGTPDDRAWVRSLVVNPEVTGTYGGSTFGAGFYDGGLCDPSDNGGLGYDYVIITREALFDFTATYNWDDLVSQKEAEGLEATKVKVEDILACPDYENPDPLFNDTPARIREFCRDAYEDWGTQYILIGGDQDGANAVTRRLLYYSYEGTVESDLYWSNLDNTFNEDHDSRWGESGDDGFDLYSELFIGSIPCDVGEDVSNWLTKSLLYANSLNQDYLDNAAFYGGNTTWLCEGDDFIDYSAIKGTDSWLGPYPDNGDPPYPEWLGFQWGFETWNDSNPGIEYDLSVKWTAEPPNPGGWTGGSESAAVNGLKDAINNDQVTLISAIAHANEHMSMDVYGSAWESQYHNTMPFFVHDYGCHCGDMDATDDGVLHSMLFHSDTELAFACVYNTGYGWGNLYNTGSSSSLQQKSFWDYLFNVTDNSGSTMNWQLGRAQAWSKDLMAPLIDWDPVYQTWRGIIESCLLFGDPAQTIKPPFISDHNVAVQTLGVPSHVTPDEMIYVNATIVNNGQNDETDVLVRFLVNDSPIDSTTIPSLGSGAIENVSFEWTPAVGWYIVTIEAEIPGVVEDVYEDNEKSKIVIAGPDIAVTSVDVRQYASVGILALVRGTVANLGTTNESITVYLKVDGAEEDSQTVYLESGTQTEVAFYWIPTYSGTYPVAIYAEADGPEPYTENNQLDDDVIVFVAKGFVLLVDDDQGKDYETYYKDALLSSEYLYDLWDRDAQGCPSLDTMLSYTAVTWFTGDDAYTTLESDDRANLSAYLDAGGNLFLTGQDIGYDIRSTDFYFNYLYATYNCDDTDILTLIGAAGDPIGDDLVIHIATGDGANNQGWPSGISVRSPATEVFIYEGSAYKGGLKVDTDVYKAVYFSFGFEAINDMYDRTEVMGRTIGWFAVPTLAYQPISHDFGDKLEGAYDSTTFEIWNSGGSTLEYTVSESCDWLTVYPSSGTSDEEHDTITVLINTTDLPLGLHSDDISITSNSSNSAFTVTVNIVEPSFIRGDANADMAVTIGDAIYALRHLFVPGSPVPPCMSAADADDNGAISISDCLCILRQQFVPGWQDSIPPPFPGCGVDPTPDELGCVFHGCMTGEIAITKDTERSGGKLVLGDPQIDFHKVVVPVYLNNAVALSGFAYTVEYDPECLIAKSADNDGLITQQFDFFAAKPDPEAGKIVVGNVVNLTMDESLPPAEHRVAEILFEFGSVDLDKSELKLADVELVDTEANVLSCEAVGVTVDRWLHFRMPKVFALRQASPNPFTGGTTIRYQLPKESWVALKIYNSSGQLVKSLLNEKQPPGYYKLEWNGEDATGTKVASGVYFCRMEAHTGLGTHTDLGTHTGPGTREFKTTKKIIFLH